MRLPVAAAGVAAGWLALAAPACAHVTVSSTDATPGGARSLSEIDLTANSAATATKPGEFDEFVVSVGPLAKAVANPVAMPHSGNGQTGSVVLASVALAVALVALDLVVLWRRTT
jgi:hypothetical protein